jgi:hypothetical protein
MLEHRHRTTATRRATRLAIGLLVISLATVLTAGPISARSTQAEPGGGIGLRLVEAPVNAPDDPRARIYIVDHLAPGTTIERRVEVSNTSGAAEEIVLYAAAATIEGGTFLGSPGQTPNDLSSWTSVTPGTTTVAAGAVADALVTIAIPDDAAPGEQYAVVWAEARSAPEGGSGVVQVSRVGIRLYVSVGAGGPPAADFEVETLTAERSPDGVPVVSAGVRNTGGRALDLIGTLDLTNGPGGLGAGPFPAELGSTLAIGDTATVRIALDEQVPDGPWDAVVMLSSGLTVRSAEATLSFASNGARDSVTAVPPAGDPNRYPLTGGVAAAVLLVALAWAFQRRRRHLRGIHTAVAGRLLNTDPTMVARMAGDAEGVP